MTERTYNKKHKAPHHVFNLSSLSDLFSLQTHPHRMAGWTEPRTSLLKPHSQGQHPAAPYRVGARPVGGCVCWKSAPKTAITSPLARIQGPGSKRGNRRGSTHCDLLSTNNLFAFCSINLRLCCSRGPGSKDRSVPTRRQTLPLNWEPGWPPLPLWAPHASQSARKGGKCTGWSD